MRVSVPSKSINFLTNFNVYIMLWKRVEKLIDFDGTDTRIKSFWVYIEAQGRSWGGIWVLFGSGLGVFREPLERLCTAFREPLRRVFFALAWLFFSSICCSFTTSCAELLFLGWHLQESYVVSLAAPMASIQPMTLLGVSMIALLGSLKLLSCTCSVIAEIGGKFGLFAASMDSTF